MADIIVLNAVAYQEKLDAFNTSAVAITTDVGALPETSSSIQTLEKYQQALLAVGKLIELYKVLLQEDISSVSQVSQDMSDTDNALSTIMNTNP